MRRILLTFAFIAAAGTAGSQTVQTPAPSTTTPDIQMNTRMNSGATAGGPAGADMAPDVANAAIPLDSAAATARKRIEMDGYRDVQGLAKGADGLWQGTAMRGNTSVQVTVDRAGNVAAK
jgi:hypothetical protein